MSRNTLLLLENTDTADKRRFSIFYGWYILAAGTLLMAACFGIIYSFSVYFIALQSEFSWNRTVTSGTFSLYLLLVGFFSIICGRSVDRFGPKPVVLTMGVITGFSLILTSRVQTICQFYVTYSVLLSAGTGGIYIIAMSTASRWFYRKRATAMGILGAGGSLGTVVMAPVSAWLIVTYQWRTAYILTGILAWILMIPAALSLKRSPAEIGTGLDGDPSFKVKPAGDPGKTDDFSVFKAITSVSFWYLALLWFWFSFCLYMVITHIVPRAQDLGLNPVRAASVMSILTAISAVSRVTGGLMADRMDKRKLIAVLTTVMAMSMVWLAAADRPWMLYPFAVVFGITFGGGDTSVIAFVTDVFGIAKVGTMMGVLMISWGLGSASGPYLAGWVFDRTGSYGWAFIIAAAGLVLTAFLSMKLKPENSLQYSTAD
jgi:MFS transporter, OFA family, oxalate/formate antiporter